MQRSKISTLVTISKIIQKYKKSWCYGSQQTILELLHRYHGVEIKRRMLNYHLSDLRDEGFIRTWGRVKREADGTLCLLSSATCLTQKGAYFLWKMGNSWALRHFKSLRKRYSKEPVKQISEYIHPTADRREVPPPTADKNPFLDRRLRKILNLKPVPPWERQVV